MQALEIPVPHLSLVKRQVQEPEYREWFAQVVVPDCDIAPDGRRLDDVVEVHLGYLPISPGEVGLAETLAWLQLENTDCLLSCVYHKDEDIEDIYF